MLAKLSIDQTLVKAKSHVKKNEIAEAQNLYKDRSGDAIGAFKIKNVTEKSKKDTNKRPTKKERRILDKIVAKTLE